MVGSFAFLTLFYVSVFKMWNTIDKTALDSNPSLHWLLREPILKGARLEIPWPPGSLIRCGVVTVKTFVQLTGGNIADTMALAAKLEIHSFSSRNNFLQALGMLYQKRNINYLRMGD